MRDCTVIVTFHPQTLWGSWIPHIICLNSANTEAPDGLTAWQVCWLCFVSLQTPISPAQLQTFPYALWSWISDWILFVLLSFLWLLPASVTLVLVCCCQFAIQQVVLYVTEQCDQLAVYGLSERRGVTGLEETHIGFCITICCIRQFTVWLFVCELSVDMCVCVCVCNWKWCLVCSLKKKTSEGCIPLEKAKVQRSVIPSKDNPPPEMNDWLYQFKVWYKFSLYF